MIKGHNSYFETHWQVILFLAFISGCTGQFSPSESGSGLNDSQSASNASQIPPTTTAELSNGSLSAPFYVQVKTSLQCLSTQSTPTDGVSVIQESCDSSNVLLFEKRQLKDGKFQLRIKDTNLCLEIPNGDMTLNSYNQLGQCQEVSHQMHSFIEGGNGAVQIQVDHSGQCLNIEEGSTNAGAKLEQWNCGNYTNQFFTTSETRPLTPDTVPSPIPTLAPNPTPTPIPSLSPNEDWQKIAIRDMRAPDGSYAANDDTLLFRGAGSSQTYRASLTMGRYGTPDAFTTKNPDYLKELSWIRADHPLRGFDWTRLNIWDQVLLSEKYGAYHAVGYKGNSRVRTWGYEMWIRFKSTGWKRMYKQDSKDGEIWRPNFKTYGGNQAPTFDYRKEPDGSTSVRPYPALGLDSTGSYWMPHGYSGGATVDPYDVADILVLCYSQLILDDPNGPDDRDSARFLFAVGSDWYPPFKYDVYPGVGTSRHKYVTKTPTLHVMHTMTEAEFLANPTPRN